MASNEKISSLLKRTFEKTVKTLSTGYQGTSLTDVFITVDKESGEVGFYDDEENNIAKIVIEDWIDSEDLSDIEISSILRSVTQKMDDEDAFAVLDVYCPFSVNYADENMLVIEELLTIDDDSIVQIDNDMLAKFDKEFDDFLEKLLKE